jgi:23S rRNA (pseudouridine1915-N3)-methyltransferase
MANKIRIITTGKAHDKLLEGAIAEYTKRLAPHLKVEWKILPPKLEAADLPTIASESNATLGILKDAEKVILLDETGTLMTSPQFSDTLAKCLAEAKDVSLIIGGAYGVSEELKKRANYTVAFGRIVLPHQLMRLVLVEQVYRAVMIQKGSAYHHD